MQNWLQTNDANYLLAPTPDTVSTHGVLTNRQPGTPTSEVPTKTLPTITDPDLRGANRQPRTPTSEVPLDLGRERQLSTYRARGRDFPPPGLEGHAHGAGIPDPGVGDLWMWLQLMWMHFEVVRSLVGVVWGRLSWSPPSWYPNFVAEHQLKPKQPFTTPS